MLCTIGCDPEGFLVNSDGESISSINLIGGTKDFPLPVPGGALQEDNVLIEFNTEPTLLMDVSGRRIPCTKFVNIVQQVKNEAQKVASKYDLSVVYASTREYPLKELNHPRAQAFGCDPDYNVYSKKRNEYPPPHPTLRGAGGHIHIGHEYIHQAPVNMESLLYLMDAFVGVPMKALEGAISERDNTYGRFGNYRPKPYGIEYRTLSSFWVQHPALIKAVFLLTQTAILMWENHYTELSGERISLDLRNWTSNIIVTLTQSILNNKNPLTALDRVLPEQTAILLNAQKELTGYVYQK